MHKVSRPYQINTYKGWLIRWYESGKQKYKTFPTKEFANLFRTEKERELNPKLYGLKKSKDRTLEQARDEWLGRYDFKELSDDSKIQATRTLRYFEEETRIKNLSDIDQNSIDAFLKARRATQISKATVNKEIRYLKAFIRWITKKGYYAGDLEIDFVKAPPIIKKSLTDDEIRKLLKACPDEAWQISILLSLCTGLRAGDNDNLTIGQIDLKRATLATIERKTGKGAIGQPIPTALIPALKKYIQRQFKNGATPESKLFPYINIRKTWDSIRIKAKLRNATRQTFRITFSTYIQKISGLETAKDLLRHSTKKITNEFYSDRQLLDRLRVEKLPVRAWIKGIF